MEVLIQLIVARVREGPRYSSDSVCVTVLNLNQRVQIRQIVLRNRFLKRSAKHGLLCQIQSRHLNILFWKI